MSKNSQSCVQIVILLVVKVFIHLMVQDGKIKKDVMKICQNLSDLAFTSKTFRCQSRVVNCGGYE